MALLIVLLLALLLSFLGLSREMASYTSLINGTGRIRGGIQRVVKLELGGQGDAAAIATMDALLRAASESPAGLLGGFGGQAGYRQLLDRLVQAWGGLKEDIRAFRGGRIPAQALVEESEALWEMANTFVDSVEGSSHRSLVVSYYLALAIAVAILGLLGVFLATKVLVKDRIEVAAEHDGLTGLYNRHYFSKVAEQELQEARRTGRRLALLMCDIDHFKRINDQHGHPVGDEALKAVAHTLGAASRSTDLLARFGGEEFVVLSLGESETGFQAYAEKLRKAVEDLRLEGGIALTISVGLAVHRAGMGLGEFVRNADEALYAAKDEGRNRVVLAKAP